MESLSVVITWRCMELELTIDDYEYDGYTYLPLSGVVKLNADHLSCSPHDELLRFVRDIIDERGEWFFKQIVGDIDLIPEISDAIYAEIITLKF